MTLQRYSGSVALGDLKTKSELRLAEVLGALSLATDLGDGFPLEKALRGSLLAVALGRELGLSEQDLSDTYYAAMLSSLGCTGFAHELASAVGGNELTWKADIATVDSGRPVEILTQTVLHLAEDRPPLERAGLFLRMLPRGWRFFELSVTATCEAADRLAGRLGMSAGVRRGLAHVFTRWDGKGVPAVAGDAIALAGRIAHFALVVEIFHRLGGRDAATAMVRQRRGDFDPTLATLFLRIGPDLLPPLETESVWDSALAAEPEPRALVTERGLDEVAKAMGDFVDLKSAFTLGHSSGVAQLAEAAARLMPLPEAQVTAVRRAGLVHDLGRIGVPNGIWEKPGPLSASAWERVRLHPYFTERILVRSAALQPFAQLAGSHHERLDGSGYHRGVPATMLSSSCRLLAAADVYHAMTEERPHRSALSRGAAAAQLGAEVSAGRLDGQVANAVLEAAGHQRSRARPSWPAGLSDREVEVLRLVAVGTSDKQIGKQLFISEVTVHHHVRHIYDKIGFSTRAGAALFAMEHDLIRRASAEE